jgi:hypothetical protein
MVGLRRLRMASNLKAFVSAARGLSRNPLGIIALFIVLVYAIAGLVTANLTPQETGITRVLVWFLVLFPVLVLAAFTYLVARHHQKVYAPSDFDDEANFMRLFEEGLGRSKRFSELKELTNKIKQEIESHPLLVFARLRVAAQHLLKSVYLAKGGIDPEAYVKKNCETQEEIAEHQEALDILKDRIGWVELRG